MGWLLEHGKFTDKDPAEAFHWYTAAAEQTMPRGFFHLGRCYQEGVGVEPDMELALDAWHQGWRLGDEQCALQLGRCYQYGQGVKSSPQLAILWYGRAAQNGSAQAVGRLGYCFEYGLGISEDKSKAAALYQKAADMGDSAAMNNLGECYLRGAGLPQDREQALRWYRLAADQGNECAMYNLGRYFEQEGDMAQALRWYRLAVKGGEESACWALGRFYEEGIQVKADRCRAFSYYQQGARKEDLPSLCRLARCYALGIGTEKDEAEARRWCRSILSMERKPWELNDDGCCQELSALKQLTEQLEQNTVLAEEKDQLI